MKTSSPAKRTRIDRMGARMALAMAIVAIGGCSSSPDSGGDNQASSTSHQRSNLPAWTSESTSTRAGNRFFVGMGTGETEDEARSKADSDAYDQFARRIGAEVVSATRMESQASYESGGVEQQDVETVDFTGIDARGFFRQAETEYAIEAEDNQYRAYARLEMPEDVVREAEQEVRADYQHRVERTAQAREILVEQQRNRADDGDAPETVFAKASATSSESLGRGTSRVEVRQEAKRQARHRAQIELNEKIHGSQVESHQAQSGGSASTQMSSTISSGRIHSEELASRSWSDGEYIHTTVTLFGWSEKE